MTTVLLIIAAVIVVLAVCAGALYISAKRQGKLAMKVGETAMRSDKVRGAVERKALEAFQDDPSMIDAALDEIGAGREMRRAAEQLKAMAPQQRAAMINAAQSGDPQAVMAAAGTGRATATSKQRAKARSKAKAARKSRKQNR